MSPPTSEEYQESDTVRAASGGRRTRQATGWTPRGTMRRPGRVSPAVRPVRSNATNTRRAGRFRTARLARASRRRSVLEVREEEGDLARRRLGRVRSVHEVLAHLDREIAANR